MTENEIEEVMVRPLLATAAVRLRDIRCRGACRHGPEECASTTELVFPYRGVFARKVGRRETVAEANQLVFFNAGDAYRVSHPAPGGDACLSLALDPALLAELAPAPLLRPTGDIAFEPARLRLEPGTQVLAARLRHGLRSGAFEPLAAEESVMNLVGRTLGPRGARTPGGSAGRQKLTDRAKLVLSRDLSRRWTLAEVAAETGGSPVYLTQVFREVEGMPLYRYQLQLRLARALDQVPKAEDLTQLGLELGFSSHSHFTAAFRKAYGRTPTAFRGEVVRSGTS